jgi:hypothetical protein
MTIADQSALCDQKKAALFSATLAREVADQAFEAADTALAVARAEFDTAIQDLKALVDALEDTSTPAAPAPAVQIG